MVKVNESAPKVSTSNVQKNQVNVKNTVQQNKIFGVPSKEPEKTEAQKLNEIEDEFAQMLEEFSDFENDLGNPEVKADEMKSKFAQIQEKFAKIQEKFSGKGNSELETEADSMETRLDEAQTKIDELSPEIGEGVIEGQNPDGTPTLISGTSIEQDRSFGIDIKITKPADGSSSASDAGETSPEEVSILEDGAQAVSEDPLAMMSDASGEKNGTRTNATAELTFNNRKTIKNSNGTESERNQKWTLQTNTDKNTPSNIKFESEEANTDSKGIKRSQTSGISADSQGNVNASHTFKKKEGEQDIQSWEIGIGRDREEGNTISARAEWHF